MSATLFKTLVRKEMRENVKWAVVVLLGMAAALAYAMPSSVDLIRARGVNLSALFNTLDAITTIGGLLAGLLIGAAQSLVENRGDKWGFLAHRPIGRTELFWGKAMAGVLLYVISTGLPVIGAFLWIASPGYLPIPFDWRIGLPATANLLAGLVFYFAGFLTGMREARWYASRALGVGAAVCCLLVQGIGAATFWQAVATTAAGLLIVGTAAWSTFVAGGHYGPQPVVGRIATAVTIGLGITLVGSLVLLMNFYRFALDEVAPGSGFTTYSVNRDGIVVRITSDSFGALESRDLNGRLLERSGNSTSDLTRRAGVMRASLSRGMLATPSFRSSSRLVSLVRIASESDPLSWHYVQRLGLIAAYDTRSRKLIGWLGPDGFSPDEASPRPFGGRLKSASQTNGDRRLLVLDDAVYRVDLDTRRVEKVFQREPTEALLDAGAARFSAPVAENSEEISTFDVISTTRRVIVQFRDGTRTLEVPQLENAARYGVLQVIRAVRVPEAPIFLWHQDMAGGEILLSEFNAAGARVNSWTLPTETRVPRNSWTQVAMFSTLAPLIGQVSLQFAQPGSQFRLPFTGFLKTTNWPLAILSSLVCLAAVLLHGRRYAFSTGRMNIWMGIALLLGPLGYLLMLALIEWPARELCPACSRKRIATRETCEHCGEPFAAPALDGTEIFAPTPNS